MVEFALVLPLLMILLLGIADFGRVFTAGITLEAAARNGAEAAAQEYTQMVRGTGAVDYARLHDVAVSEVCREAKALPNTTFDAGNCPSMPVIAVCVHDASEGDAACGTTAQAVPAQCTSIAGWVSPSPADTAPVLDGAAEPLPYIEVRTCYRFTTLFNLHLNLPFSAGLNLGDVWLQRDRTFTVGDY
jgi:Flp pilus assembly protein TadG